MKNKDAHFAFFESYHRALSRISNEVYGRVVRAMCDYYFKGQEPTFDNDMDYVVWDLIEPVLTKGKEISTIRAKVGKSGGHKGKGVSRNIGNCNAKIINGLDRIKANNSKSLTNNSGIGIGIGNKESTNVPKKDGLSLPPKTSLKHKQEQMVARKAEFQNSLGKHLDRNGGGYSADMLNEFFSYWTEPNKSQTKMRFEQQPTWDMSRRLARWEKNNYKYGKGGNS